MDFSHIPVLLEEVLAELKIKENGIYIDGTVGGAGHSSEIAKRLGSGGRLYGLDRDSDAIAAATERLAPYADRVEVIKSSFSEMNQVLTGRMPGRADGILLDLGVSSKQLDTPTRGFTYREEDAPLDMRMDQEKALSAETVVNTYSEEELKRILRDYGEERFAGPIAKEIVKTREAKAIRTAGQLTDVIRRAMPQKALRTQGHPAKRTFQAIRIEVNGELSELETFLSFAPDLLAEGGRLLIITFHSLEDRIVKNRMRTWENPCTCPKEFPVCVCGKKPIGRVINRKPIVAGDEEREQNPRSKSAKLRVFEKKM